MNGGYWTVDIADDKIMCESGLEKREREFYAEDAVEAAAARDYRIELFKKDTVN